MATGRLWSKLAGGEALEAHGDSGSIHVLGHEVAAPTTETDTDLCRCVVLGMSTVSLNNGLLSLSVPCLSPAAFPFAEALTCSAVAAPSG